MSIISRIRDWIAKECPCLDDFRALFVDFLPEGADAYSLEVTPSEPIVQRYINGDTLRRKQFSFCSRVCYNDLDNLDTSEFFDDFQAWLEDCTEKRILPELKEGQEAKSLTALTDGYLYDQAGNKAQYRIQCEFIYYQKRSV